MTRASLLAMAQKWFDLANGSPRRNVFDAAVRAFSEGQMTLEPVTQQQQQIQPKKEQAALSQLGHGDLQSGQVAMLAGSLPLHPDH
jgi:hypothetical protein